MTLGAVLPDDIWKPAIEATGGKFFAAGDEATILNAVQSLIDQHSEEPFEVVVATSGGDRTGDPHRGSPTSAVAR